MPAPLDLLVLGAGPAGLAAARAAAQRGLTVAVVDPAPDRPWPNNYGSFVDELAALGLERAFRATWPTTRIHLDDARSLPLDRPYGRVDGAALRARLAAGLELRQGAVGALEYGPTGVTATLVGGATLQARLALDASGAKTPFVRRARARPAFQTALGGHVTLRAAPWPADEMRLMDFGPVGEGPDASPPTFLYAMPEGGGRWFVEETVLVGRPPPDFESLEARLRARLAAAGCLEVGPLEGVERCLIPMGIGLPDGRQPLLALGAAAGMVHPATGYSLALSLRAALPLLDAVVAALGADGGSPAAAAAAGWESLWPRERRRTWALLTYGMEVLCRLEAPGVRDFFGAFFTVEAWPGFLSGTQTLAELTATMRAVFAAAPWSVRAKLMGPSLSPPGRRMLRALLG